MFTLSFGSLIFSQRKNVKDKKLRRRKSLSKILKLSLIGKKTLVHKPNIKSAS